MPDSREKLLKLLWRSFPCESEREQFGVCPDRRHGVCTLYEKLPICTAQKLADYLIANSVTFETDNNVVNRWIPVTEKLPEPGRIVMVHQVYSWEGYEAGTMVTIGRLRPVPPEEKPYWEFQYYRPDFRNRTAMDNGIICPGNEYVTHWMPLPEPPDMKCQNPL